MYTERRQVQVTCWIFHGIPLKSIAYITSIYNVSFTWLVLLLIITVHRLNFAEMEVSK